MDYQTANKIVPESDGEKVIASLYKKLSIPVLKPADKDIGNIYEAYQNMKSRIELLEGLSEAEDDVRNGRVGPVSDTFNSLRAILQEYDD